jgi:hypothetical protein
MCIECKVHETNASKRFDVVGEYHLVFLSRVYHSQPPSVSRSQSPYPCLALKPSLVSGAQILCPRAGGSNIRDACITCHERICLVRSRGIGIAGRCNVVLMDLTDLDA